MSKIASELKHSTIVYTYPCGVVDIIHSTSGFMEAGWEPSAPGEEKTKPKAREKGKVAEGADLERSMRRARAKLRRLALANEFRWFVTLTLDPAKIDRSDGKAVAHALGRWADNMVRRKGLKYALVPELHKKGGIHFHGFFNDAVEVVNSGHYDAAGHPIFNLPEWTLGFTTAIELYGDYPSAVGYVTKYIGKQGLRPMGRWYYSGGRLAEPSKTYADLDRSTLIEENCGILNSRRKIDRNTHENGGKRMICKQKLNKAMDRLGYAEKTPGTAMIRAGVAMVDADRRAMMCKDIYPTLAKATGRTTAGVERAMRTATERAMRSPMWEKEWREMGGWNHPSNSEVIRRLARECSAD